jgi:HD-GYP domain-containing protein (c-di-GMP phosphodiesterase class II)
LSTTAYSVDLYGLVMAMSAAVDFVSPLVAGHHKRVAYYSLLIGEEAGLDETALREVFLAASLHDIGAFSLQERVDVMSFELAQPETHSVLGYLFLKRFLPFASVAQIVRYHHRAWHDGEAAIDAESIQIPLLSRLVNLADRVDVLYQHDKHILSQVECIRERIQKSSGVAFMPEFTDAFVRLSAKESFWLDAVSPFLGDVMSRRIGDYRMELSQAEMEELARLLAHIIDYKSPYTSTHSCGVAASAVKLAEVCGMQQHEISRMRIAGLLHDLGKLSVPSEILNKPAKLSVDETFIMRGHTYNTRRVLERIGGLGEIVEWASSHHERMDGSGYPFHDEAGALSLGARVVSVADVFTALAEDRPYRAGMGRDTVLEIIRDMAEKGALDCGIVDALEDQYEDVDTARREAQDLAKEEYRAFSAEARAYGGHMGL